MKLTKACITLALASTFLLHSWGIDVEVTRCDDASLADDDDNLAAGATSKNHESFLVSRPPPLFWLLRVWREPRPGQVHDACGDRILLYFEPDSRDGEDDSTHRVASSFL